MRARGAARCGPRPGYKNNHACSIFIEYNSQGLSQCLTKAMEYMGVIDWEKKNDTSGL